MSAQQQQNHSEVVENGDQYQLLPYKLVKTETLRDKE